MNVLLSKSFTYTKIIRDIALSFSPLNNALLTYLCSPFEQILTESFDKSCMFLQNLKMFYEIKVEY